MRLTNLRRCLPNRAFNLDTSKKHRIYIFIISPHQISYLIVSRIWGKGQCWGYKDVKPTPTPFSMPHPQTLSILAHPYILLYVVIVFRTLKFYLLATEQFYQKIRGWEPCCRTEVGQPFPARITIKWRVRNAIRSYIITTSMSYIKAFSPSKIGIHSIAGVTSADATMEIGMEDETPNASPCSWTSSSSSLCPM